MPAYWLRRALRYVTDGRHEASYVSDASGIDSMVIEPGGQTVGQQRDSNGPTAHRQDNRLGEPHSSGLSYGKKPSEPVRHGKTGPFRVSGARPTARTRRTAYVSQRTDAR
jgi:hypothetical protein